MLEARSWEYVGLHIGYEYMYIQQHTLYIVIPNSDLPGIIFKPTLHINIMNASIS